MTLRTVLKKYPRLYCMTYAGSKVVYVCPGEAGYRELFRLHDYKVSTVGAGVVWLSGV